MLDRNDFNSDAASESDTPREERIRSILGGSSMMMSFLGDAMRQEDTYYHSRLL